MHSMHIIYYRNSMGIVIVYMCAEMLNKLCPKGCIYFTVYTVIFVLFNCVCI